MKFESSLQLEEILSVDLQKTEKKMKFKLLLLKKEPPYFSPFKETPNLLIALFINQ